MELNLEAMMNESGHNISVLQARCMMLAGENAVLKQKLAEKENKDNVVPLGRTEK
jgi:hypothetical protein